MAGLTGFISYEPQRRKELVEKLLKGMAKAVLIVERQAKEDCVVDTGRLRSSITSKVEQAEGDITGVVGTNVEYASFIEQGTSKMAAQPFLYPALESQKDRIKDALKNG